MSSTHVIYVRPDVLYDDDACYSGKSSEEYFCLVVQENRSHSSLKRAVAAKGIKVGEISRSSKAEGG